MGSINPVFVLPGAIVEKKDEIAAGLAASVTLGVGQFCTNPGLVAYEESEDGSRFQEAVADSIKQIDTGNMLTSGIGEAFEDGQTDPAKRCKYNCFREE